MKREMHTSAGGSNEDKNIRVLTNLLTVNDGEWANETALGLSFLMIFVVLFIYFFLIF